MSGLAGPLVDDAPQMREKCGLFGVVGVDSAAALVSLGLHALQHRGQDGAGITAFRGERFKSMRHLGLVGDEFEGAELAKRLPGDRAIGHVRYSTSGSAVDPRNLQPLTAELHAGGFAIAHNGELTNAMTLRERLIGEGKIFQSGADTEVLLHLLAGSKRGSTIDRFIDALEQVDGGYALVALSANALIGARDPIGLRPLVLGDLDGKPVLSSESCALKLIGAKLVRDLEPGEVIIATPDGVREIKRNPGRRPRTCAFEYIYFARPNSVIDQVSVYAARKAMGAILAEETGVDADVVVPVPDSGIGAAIGYAEAAGLPFDFGIIRSHFVGRTFIQAKQGVRIAKVRLKHQANDAALAGRRVVLVDDSIVRGTTSKEIVAMVREAGAREIHFRSASPPITHPDRYGINMARRDKLFAVNHPTLDAMRAELKVDSIGFISTEGLRRAIASCAPDGQGPDIADHCFTGDYPTSLIDEEGGGQNPDDDEDA